MLRRRYVEKKVCNIKSQLLLPGRDESFLTLRIHDIFLCLSRVKDLVTSSSALLCSRYHLFVTTASARVLVEPNPTDTRGEEDGLPL